MPETPKSFETQPCEVPPRGWKCNRAKGHDGPCAAIPLLDLHRSFAQEAVDLLESQGDGYAYAHERIIGLLQLEARQCASLPPQAAAVPARQDAVHVSIRGEIDRDNAIIADTVARGAFFQDWRLASLAAKKGHRAMMVTTAGDFIVLTDLQELELRSALSLPPQAAVGGGELPKLPEINGDSPDTCYYRIMLRNYSRECNKVLREAIAQRDEARKWAQQMRRQQLDNMVALDVPKPESGE